jgi:hypothetical protein
MIISKDRIRAEFAQLHQQSPWLSQTDIIKLVAISLGLVQETVVFVLQEA